MKQKFIEKDLISPVKADNINHDIKVQKFNITFTSLISRSSSSSSSSTSSKIIYWSSNSDCNSGLIIDDRKSKSSKSTYSMPNSSRNNRLGALFSLIRGVLPNKVFITF